MKALHAALVPLALLGMGAAPGAKSRPRCEGNPAVVEACFTVRGRLSAYNGNPTFRLWPFGTKRLLGVVHDTNEVPNMPDALRERASFDADITGEFRVCPFTKEQSGVMCRVCIESATGWKVEPRR